MSGPVWLDTVEDLQWLRDVHQIDATPYAGALLYGQEDWPEKVELYARDHYRCRPTIYVPDETGRLVLQKFGQQPLHDPPQHRTDAEKLAQETHG